MNEVKNFLFEVFQVGIFAYLIGQGILNLFGDNSHLYPLMFVAVAFFIIIFLDKGRIE